MSHADARSFGVEAREGATMTSVLVVEDDAVYRGVLSRTLDEAGFATLLASDLREAVAVTREVGPDLALVDLRLGEGHADGIEVVRHLSRRWPLCRCVMLTGHGTIAAAVEAMRAGAVDFRTKPIERSEVIEALRDALDPLPAETLEQVERAHILGVLQACGGNISEAARRLGLYRRTLQRKLQKLPPA
jgi:two-component system response regulator RegA